MYKSEKNSNLLLLFTIFWLFDTPFHTSGLFFLLYAVILFLSKLCLNFSTSLLLQTKCFICGIGSEYFDKVPHGFETHTLQEHNLANYL